MHAVLSQLYVHLCTYNSPFLLGIVAVGLYGAVNFAQATLLSAKASMMARIMLTAAIYQKVCMNLLYLATVCVCVYMS